LRTERPLRIGVGFPAPLHAFSALPDIVTVKGALSVSDAPHTFPEFASVIL
jgi:hypothetical protein